MLNDVIVLKYFFTWAFSFWHIISINDHDIYTKDLEVTLVPELKVLTCLISVAFVISEVLVYLLNYDMWLLLLWQIHFYKWSWHLHKRLGGYPCAWVEASKSSKKSKKSKTEEEDEYGEEEYTDDGMINIILKMCIFQGWIQPMFCYFKWSTWW